MESYQVQPDYVRDEWFINFALFEPLCSTLLQFGTLVRPPSVDELNRNISVQGIKFISQQPKSNNFEDGYEPRIFLKREVQTRENNWHDFFNALVWQAFPKSKNTLNQLHFNFQQSRYPSKQRLAAENMLTLFDENGAIVIASDELYLTLIREHKWQELFWQRRQELKDNLKVIVFGHSIYEKALCPYIGLTAKCLMFAAKDFSLSCADSMLANFLQHHKNILLPSLLSPLPILGVPGWWMQNDNEEFYANKNYFRPKIAKS